MRIFSSLNFNLKQSIVLFSKLILINLEGHFGIWIRQVFYWKYSEDSIMSLDIDTLYCPVSDSTPSRILNWEAEHEINVRDIKSCHKIAYILRLKAIALFNWLINEIYIPFCINKKYVLLAGNTNLYLVHSWSYIKSFWLLIICFTKRNWRLSNGKSI